MSKIRFVAAALVAVSCAAGAAPPAAVNLDGSTKGPTLAASANRQLANNAVPSAKNDPDLKTAADADIQQRQQRPKLKAERQNLKGADAKSELAKQQNPSTYDRDIQMGNDKDHIQQATDVKVYIKK